MTTISHSEIQSALSEIARRFSDTRIQHCQIEIARFDGRICALSGSVLDMTTLDVVGAALNDRFHVLPAGQRTEPPDQVRSKFPGRLPGQASNLGTDRANFKTVRKGTQGSTVP